MPGYLSGSRLGWPYIQPVRIRTPKVEHCFLKKYLSSNDNFTAYTFLFIGPQEAHDLNHINAQKYSGYKQEQKWNLQASKKSAKNCVFHLQHKTSSQKGMWTVIIITSHQNSSRQFIRTYFRIYQNLLEHFPAHPCSCTKRRDGEEEKPKKTQIFKVKR